MATVTPNFNWPVPTSTDLVKDGATAIEALGDSIDASFVDLKGGTTGQVLAKASNTDLDYSWVAQDDSNAIQNTIVDAKGDLIAATAADTPARLAVGANDAMLVGDSTAAVGLSYKSAATLYAWTTYNPSPSGLTTGNGTMQARYAQIGKTVFVEIDFLFGSTSAITGFTTFGLPVTAKTANYTFVGTMSFGKYAVATYQGAANFISTTSFGLVAIKTNGTYAVEDAITATVPFTWGTSDRINVRLTYEAA
jgi:hypothetical protein